MSFDSSGDIDLRDVTVHSDVSILAFIHHGRAEGGAGQCVIQTNPKRYFIRNTEALELIRVTDTN